MDCDTEGGSVTDSYSDNGPQITERKRCNKFEFVSIIVYMLGLVLISTICIAFVSDQVFDVAANWMLPLFHIFHLNVPSYVLSVNEEAFNFAMHKSRQLKNYYWL